MTNIDLIKRYETVIVKENYSKSKHGGAIAKKPDGTYWARYISSYNETGRPEYTDICGKSRFEVNEKLINAVFKGGEAIG